MTAVQPVAQVLTAAQARNLTDEIKGALIIAYDRLIECWQGRADQALGYESWEAYCAAEFAESRMVRLAREQRREIVESMRQAGMSTRAIASGIGVSNGTAAEDARRVLNSEQSDTTVTSLDGRQRPASNVRDINASTPQSLIDQHQDEAQRALPAYHIGGRIDELLSKPVEDPEGMVRDLPDRDRHVLDRVPDAIDYLTRIEHARRTT